MTHIRASWRLREDHENCQDDHVLDGKAAARYQCRQIFTNT